MRLTSVLFYAVATIAFYFITVGYAQADFLLLKKLLALRQLADITSTTTTTTTLATTTTTTATTTTSEPSSSTISSILSNGKLLSDAAVPLVMEFYKFIKKNKTMEDSAKLLLTQFMPQLTGNANTLDSAMPVITDAKWIRKHVKPLLKSFLESDADNEVSATGTTTAEPKLGTELQTMNRTGRGWGGGCCCCGGGGGGGSDNGLLAAVLASQNNNNALDSLLPLLFGLIALLIMKLPT
ncbi:uncharacterized protein LOC129593775 [Paramacrobiotus metropolitanus]|uniref:uncharacterized protein LOC129593775 n=1 Tax=Paramacrobiotus metropolitanus TaxID=2943436 RepID=UPI002445A80E|nr:uncharacterized protein LOC129593775 [Paramacrobiotus metropolitanus]